MRIIFFLRCCWPTLRSSCQKSMQKKKPLFCVFGIWWLSVFFLYFTQLQSKLRATRLWILSKSGVLNNDFCVFLFLSNGNNEKIIILRNPKSMERLCWSEKTIRLSSLLNYLGQWTFIAVLLKSRAFFLRNFVSLLPK